MSEGEIVQVIGPVVDVKFPLDNNLPDINNALRVKVSNDETIVLEVTLELGDGVLRTIAMESTNGLRRGMKVENTGGPISVPVGEDGRNCHSDFADTRSQFVSLHRVFAQGGDKPLQIGFQ